MTMMMAKCLAKGCFEKATENEIKDFKKWKPCMGCRSHWIHVACGGFCSECQPLENSKSKRSSDRSPLTIKQSLEAKRLEDSAGFREGKENASLSGKRQRKPVAPPALTPSIAAPSIDENTENSRKRKLSLEPNLTENSSSAPAKKRRISTAPGGTPKKYASEPHAKLPRKKIVVEVKMAEDGTHNPDRLLYHVKNNQPIDQGEVEAEESYEWLRQMSSRQIEEFVDLNEGEKAFFTMWNTYLHYHPCYGDKMLFDILNAFVDEQGLQIHRKNLYKNFMLHLSNLHSYGAISSSAMLSLVGKYQSLIKDSLEFPAKYPLISEPKIVDNPYYVPKPAAIAETMSLKKLTKPVIIHSRKEPKVSKSFWLKKSFRNSIVDQLEEDEKRWPRKKAVVTFANEIFVEEILDHNQKPTFLHDVTDLYKLISPRQRRGKS